MRILEHLLLTCAACKPTHALFYVVLCHIELNIAKMQRSVPVLVGRPGECVAPGAGTHHDTYMGDVFSAPPGCEMSAPKCPVCGAELSLIFQVRALQKLAATSRCWQLRNAARSAAAQIMHAAPSRKYSSV